MRLPLPFVFLAPLSLLCLAVPASADDNDAVPYWAALLKDEAFMRVGPGETYKIAWVYRRVGLPMKVLRREGVWRLVQDPDGTRGWMRDLLLTRKRGAIVVGHGPVALRVEPRDGAAAPWNIEPGVVGMLNDCKDGWCPFEVKGHKGYLRETEVWGAGKP